MRPSCADCRPKACESPGMKTRYALIWLTILVMASCKKAPDVGGGSGSGSSGGSSTPTDTDAAAPASTPDAPVIEPVDAYVPAPSVDAATKPAAQHASCLGGGACERGLTCVEYIGITGAKLASCEIPCAGGSGCPAGQKCLTVKDGPGQVCQRSSGGSPGSGSSGPIEPPPGSGGGSGAGSGSSSGALPKQAQTCPGGKCAAGLECVEYFGIAGPRGPKFTSCEIRCGGGKPCPGGQRCITIADGPGQVCRP